MLTYYLVVLLIWNLLVFVVYGLDKRRAQKGQWRISEKTLLIMALFFGGWGALLAGKVFRHKTRKWYFVVTWYVAILLTLALAYWLGQTFGWNWYPIGGGR